MINLLPSDLKTDRRYGRRNRTLRNYSLVLFLIGICSTLVMFLNSRLIAADEKNLRAEISQKQAQAAALEPIQKKYEKLAADLKTIEQLYGGEVVFSQLLPEIGGLLPSGTILNGLTLASGKKDAPLNLEIDMESQELAAVFQQNLTKSDLFEAADITVITSKGEGDDGGYAYSATLSAKFLSEKKPTTNTQTGGTNQ